MSVPAGPIGLRVIGPVAVEMAAAVGSVPTLFRLVTATSAPHAAYLQATAGWVEVARAAVAEGALAVLAAGPARPSDAELDALALLPVVLLGTRLHAPQLRALAGELVEDPDWIEVLVVDGSATEFDPRAALWDAVAMLTAAGLAIDSVPRVVLAPGVVLADTTCGSARVHLSCVHRRGAVARATIKIFGASGSVEAAMGDPAVASPGEVLAVSGKDAVLSGTSYQTPLRVALTELHAALSSDPVSLPGRSHTHAHATRLLNQVAWDNSQPATQLKWKESD